MDSRALIDDTIGRIKALLRPHSAASRLKQQSSPRTSDAKPRRDVVVRQDVAPCCRSAATLVNVAQQVTDLVDSISAGHRHRVAELRRELALSQQTSIEWDIHFGRRTTPCEVKEELLSLRHQLRDLEERCAVMEAQRKRDAAHLDAVYALMRQHH